MANRLVYYQVLSTCCIFFNWTHTINVMLFYHEDSSTNIFHYGLSSPCNHKSTWSHHLVFPNYLYKFVPNMRWTPCLHHISSNLFPLCDYYLKLVPRIQFIKCHKVFFFFCFNQCNNLPMFPTMLVRFSEWISMKSYICEFSNF